MNVLVDRHHAGLLHSLQLLGARLGWDVYVPTGMEWWDAGFWNFGRFHYGDDRLARQFLLADTPDGEFPDTPIETVTLDEAEAMPWRFVIASVPENEGGYARFARMHDARFIVQVGNTGQWPDWTNGPLVISSSELPLDERGIRYHQEMDPVPFVPPVIIDTAASFVNCMPSMGSCWDLLSTARTALDVRVYGIDGPQGIVKPYSELVRIMASVGWGWHDKAQGDGFGHVIHSWAQVGRPLIGHSSHYRGKMAEVFWRDGETCIDLDIHPLDEALAIIGGMTSRRHSEMCHAIRAEFERIDYAAEAEAIRAFLGAA